MLAQRVVTVQACAPSDTASHSAMALSAKGAGAHLLGHLHVAAVLAVPGGGVGDDAGGLPQARPPPACPPPRGSARCRLCLVKSDFRICARKTFGSRHANFAGFVTAAPGPVGRPRGPLARTVSSRPGRRAPPRPGPPPPRPPPRGSACRLRCARLACPRPRLRTQRFHRCCPQVKPLRWLGCTGVATPGGRAAAAVAPRDAPRATPHARRPKRALLRNAWRKNVALLRSNWPTGGSAIRHTRSTRYFVDAGVADTLQLYVRTQACASFSQGRPGSPIPKGVGRPRACFAGLCLGLWATEARARPERRPMGCGTL